MSDSEQKVEPIVDFALTDEERRRFRETPPGKDFALDDLRMAKMRDLTAALEAAMAATVGSPRRPASVPEASATTGDVGSEARRDGGAAMGDEAARVGDAGAAVDAPPVAAAPAPSAPEIRGPSLADSPPPAPRLPPFSSPGRYGGDEPPAAWAAPPTPSDEARSAREASSMDAAQTLDATDDALLDEPTIDASPQQGWSADLPFPASSPAETAVDGPVRGAALPFVSPTPSERSSARPRADDDALPFRRGPAPTSAPSDDDLARYASICAVVQLRPGSPEALARFHITESELAALHRHWAATFAHHPALAKRHAELTRHYVQWLENNPDSF